MSGKLGLTERLRREDEPMSTLDSRQIIPMIYKAFSKKTDLIELLQKWLKILYKLTWPIIRSQPKLLAIVAVIIAWRLIADVLHAVHATARLSCSCIVAYCTTMQY